MQISKILFSPEDFARDEIISPSRISRVQIERWKKDGRESELEMEFGEYNLGTRIGFFTDPNNIICPLRL